MLVISRKLDELVQLELKEPLLAGEKIYIQVCRLTPHNCRLGIKAPVSVRVSRPVRPESFNNQSNNRLP